MTKGDYCSATINLMHLILYKMGLVKSWSDLDDVYLRHVKKQKRPKSLPKHKSNVAKIQQNTKGLTKSSLICIYVELLSLIDL